MGFNKHWLDWARRDETKHIGGYIKPTIGIVHESGTRIKKGAAVRYCRKNSRKVSYHFLIERDGELVQMAPVNRRTNHAGRSSWKGAEWCNSFSTGIALVGPTELGPMGKAFFGRVFENRVKAGSPYHGNKHYWLPYTEEQKATLDKLVVELKAAYGQEIVGHYHVSPGRKIDPSPLIDLEKVGAPAVKDLPPVAPVEPTHKILKRQSREYKAADRSKKVIGITTIGVTGLEISKSLGIENITATKAYLDVFKGFIDAYGVFILIGACVGGYLVFEAIQNWKRASYDDGRYEASGAQEEEQLNEGGGDWA